MSANQERAAEALYAAAHFFFEADRPKDASHIFRMMTVCAPSDERGWLGLGLCHERLEQLEIALQMYAVGQLASAPAPRCAYAMAILQRKLGELVEAENTFDIAERCAERRGDEKIARLIERERRAA